MSNEKCYVCQDDATVKAIPPEMPTFYFCQCSLCGKFYIGCYAIMFGDKLLENHAKIAAVIRSHNAHGNHTPTIYHDQESLDRDTTGRDREEKKYHFTIDHMIAQYPKSLEDRIAKSLANLYALSEEGGFGTPVVIGPKDYPLLYAASSGREAVTAVVDTLAERGFVKGSGVGTASMSITLTSEGWNTGEAFTKKTGQAIGFLSREDA